MSTVMLMFGLGIGYKLFHLQFIDGDKYRKIAEEKTLKRRKHKGVFGVFQNGFRKETTRVVKCFRGKG